MTDFGSYFPTRYFDTGGSVTTPATATATQVTKRELRRLLAEQLGGLFTGVAKNGGTVPAPIEQTTERLVDASPDGIADTAYDKSRFDKGWLLLAHAAPTPIESHRIKAYNPAEGSLTIGRTFATTPVSDVTEYEVHTHGADPADLDRGLAWAAQNAAYPDVIVLCGLVPDGDMADSTQAHWGVGGPGTITRTYASGALRLQTTGAGYAASDAIAVDEGQSYRVFCSVRPSTGTATPVVWDVTHGAAITVQWQGDGAADAGKGTAEHHLLGHFLAPAGCASVMIRLQGSAGSDSTWRNVGLYRLNDRQIAYPGWLPDPRGSTIALYDRVRTGNASYLLEPIPPIGEPEGTRLPISPSELAGALAARVARPFTLAAETDAVGTEYQDWLLLGALREVYRVLSRPRAQDSARYLEEYQDAKRQWFVMCADRHPINTEGRVVWR